MPLHLRVNDSARTVQVNPSPPASALSIAVNPRAGLAKTYLLMTFCHSSQKDNISLDVKHLYISIYLLPRQYGRRAETETFPSGHRDTSTHVSPPRQYLFGLANY